MGWFTLISNALSAWTTTLNSINTLTAYLKKADEEKWFQNNAAAFRPIEQGPSTSGDKDAAAKAIADSIHSL